MANVLEIIVKAQDMASEVIEGVGEQAGETGSFIQENWGKIAAVTAVAGAASEGFARSQGATNAILDRAALVTGETDEALRASIDSMTNWTFSSHDAAAGMEELMKRGVDTKAGFEATLPVMDNFADATGRTVVDAIKIFDGALGALGIPLEEAGDHVDTFTFLSERTRIPLEQFERQIGKVGPELREMGIDLDESAAIMAALEGKGLSGREAIRTFAEEAERSGGDLETMMAALELNEDALQGYRDEIAGATGMTDDFANANNSNMTLMERAQQTLANLGAKFGGLASVASAAGPALLGFSAMTTIVGKTSLSLTSITGGLSKAMAFLAANPIILVIAALALLAAGVVMLWKNSETFRNIVLAVWEAIQTAIQWAWDNVIQPVWKAIQVGIDILIRAIKIYLGVWKAVFTGVADAVKWAWNNVISPTWDALKRGIDLIKGAIDTFKGTWSRAWDAIKNAVKGPANGIIGFINAVLTGVEKLVNGLGSAINKIPKFTVPSWVPGIGGNSFGLPRIPSVSLPRVPTLAAGGIALATPGGFLARIAEGGRNERISPLGGPDDPMTELVKMMRELISAVREARTLSVDGRDLASAIGFPLVEEIRARTGL